MYTKFFNFRLVAILAVTFAVILYYAFGSNVAGDSVGTILNRALQPRAIAEAPPDSSLQGASSRERLTPEGDPLLVRLKELQLELVSLSAQYTDAHPDIIQLKQDIADVKAQLEQKYGSDIAAKKVPLPSDREPNKPEVDAPVGEKTSPYLQRDVRSAAGMDHSKSTGVTAEPSGISTEEKLELAETARLLAVLLDAGRVVVGKAQQAINNPRLENKGFSSAVFESQLRAEFLARTGHDLRNLAPAPLPDRAKPLLVRLAFFMQKAVQDVQPLINQKGIGFKGFIPATFGTKVADQFSKDTGLKLRQIGPPGVAPRNPNNKPDEQEEQALRAAQKSHPRVGDHVIEQQLPNDAVRVLLPLFYKKACLACHGKPKGDLDISGYDKEGFKEGDLGGAISIVLFPGNQLLNAEKAR
jgi:general secretion pathway protein A